MKLSLLQYLPYLKLLQILAQVESCCESWSRRFSWAMRKIVDVVSKASDLQLVNLYTVTSNGSTFEGRTTTTTRGLKFDYEQTVRAGWSYYRQENSEVCCIYMTLMGRRSVLTGLSGSGTRLVVVHADVLFSPASRSSLSFPPSSFTFFFPFDWARTPLDEGGAKSHSTHPLVSRRCPLDFALFSTFLAVASSSVYASLLCVSTVTSSYFWQNAIVKK
jgi:hypothetical protein